ncbi:hypothetical protein HUT16_28620 [Kitasatospora sp. NA04385]|uniref:hypothetical protein n=1 Tax=Kitasatospora sp. NA04385 TaxID=2742135 RepID=UPI00159075E6|nr:hypothetical protein [Kitasatospora sp. NA04385]QKW22517.1 hypothetical protein HUT16_28620 [Kitasatospora sp. NA04385]
MGPGGRGSALRRRGGVLGAGLALAATSACTAGQDGAAGLSMTEDGHPIGVLALCGREMAAVNLDTTVAGQDGRFGTWTPADPLDSGTTTWRLDGPAEGWSATAYVGALDPGTGYRLYAHSADNGWYTTEVSFTAADLDGLAPGTVRYDRTEPDGSTTTVVAPLARFTAEACRKR